MRSELSIEQWIVRIENRMLGLEETLQKGYSLRPGQFVYQDLDRFKAQIEILRWVLNEETDDE